MDNNDTVIRALKPYELNRVEPFGPLKEFSSLVWTLPAEYRNYFWDIIYNDVKFDTRPKWEYRYTVEGRKTIRALCSAIIEFKNTDVYRPKVMIEELGKKIRKLRKRQNILAGFLEGLSYQNLSAELDELGHFLKRQLEHVCLQQQFVCLQQQLERALQLRVKRAYKSLSQQEKVDMNDSTKLKLESRIRELRTVESIRAQGAKKLSAKIESAGHEIQEVTSAITEAQATISDLERDMSYPSQQDTALYIAELIRSHTEGQ